jgi:hypothetical protein
MVRDKAAFIIYEESASLSDWLVVLVEGFYKNNAWLYLFN